MLTNQKQIKDLLRIKYACPLWKNDNGNFDSSNYEIDHIIPRSKGGPNDEDNLQALCQSCHSHKSNHIDFMILNFGERNDIKLNPNLGKKIAGNQRYQCANKPIYNIIRDKMRKYPITSFLSCGLVFSGITYKILEEYIDTEEIKKDFKKKLNLNN